MGCGLSPLPQNRPPEGPVAGLHTPVGRRRLTSAPAFAGWRDTIMTRAGLSASSGRRSFLLTRNAASRAISASPHGKLDASAYAQHAPADRRLGSR
jgi:hypothetical protein